MERQAEVGPPPELRFRRSLSPWQALRELWAARHLARTLAERDLRARYKQTFLGAAWAMILPVTLMLVFNLFFTRVADIDTGGAPYTLFAYIGLLPWTFFSSSVSNGSQSLLANMALLNKVRCPREIFPIGTMSVAAVDTSCAGLVLIVLFAINTYAPRPETLFVPLLLAVQLAFTLGMTLILSASTVYLRDLRQALPIVLQLGLFATPVAYNLFDVLPEWTHLIYSALNPLAPVIDGYRRTVLQGMAPQWDLLGVAAVSALCVLVGGFAYFKRLETGIADIA